MPYCFLGSSIKFQGHTGWQIDDLNPIWVRLLGRSQLSNPSDLPCFFMNENNTKSQPQIRVKSMWWCTIVICEYVTCSLNENSTKQVDPTTVHDIHHSEKKRSSLKAGFILVYFINARIRAYAPHWATSIANIAPRRCVVNYKYEHTRVYACKLPWRLYPLVERDPRKRIWLDEISTPALKVQLVWTLGRTYARIRAYTRAELYAGSMNCSAYVRVYARIRAREVWIQLKVLNCDRNACPVAYD